MAALLSLLINKHGQKQWIVPFTSVELIKVVLKNIIKQNRQNWETKKLQLSQETFRLLFYSGSEVQRRHFCGVCKTVVLKPWPARPSRVAREAIFIGKKTKHFNHLREFFREFLLRLLILVAREGFLKDKCGPRAKTFEHHCCKRTENRRTCCSRLRCT